MKSGILNQKNLMFLFFVLGSFLIGCVIKSPSITFTQTQTSSEKQMIGEDRILEKDGWLISSVKTSSAGSEVWKRDFSGDNYAEGDKNILMSLKVLAYLAPEVKTWKEEGLLAEGLDGKLRINPVAAAGIRNEKEVKSRIDSLVALVNEHRSKAIASRFEANSKTDKKEKSEHLKTHLEQTWYRLVEKGEYYEKSPGKWVRKE
ncbi:Putative lipoprotein [Leptospira santarosai]|uniref:Lipoprotein n=1 Tax=Leptospira santarosai TaxID=28183 RepID=A0A2P1QVT4_9LEPT|nr:Putative lipoprotein [Leptospira santarosai]